MMNKGRSTENEEKLLLKEEKTSQLDRNFDWDWIFDREWLRTKK